MYKIKKLITWISVKMKVSVLKTNFSNLLLKFLDCSSGNETSGLKIPVSWSYEQTKYLIQSMANHICDLNHPVKRKHVYENISNDLASKGYIFNSTSVQNKWKSLNRSYTKAKDNKKNWYWTIKVSVLRSDG